MTTATIRTSEHQRTFTSAWVDANGVPVAAPGYGFPNWTADDNGAIVSLAQIGVGGGQCTVTMTGAPGTFNLKATSSKAGAPDLVGAVAVTVQGPIPDHLNIELLPNS